MVEKVPLPYEWWGGGGPRASPREDFKFRPSENQFPVIFESSFGDLSSQEEPFP